MSEIVEFSPVAPVLATLEEPSPPTRLEVPVKARNVGGRDMFVRVSVSAQDKAQATWFTVPPALGRVELKAGQELSIPVTVEIPGKTPFDKHGFRVLVADDAAPEIDFSLSPVITVQRSQKMVDHSWWKWVALGVGVAAVAAVILVVLLSRGTPLGAACDPADSDCRGGVCPPEVRSCVGPKGVACESDAQCLSNKCADGKCAATVLGGACYPSNPACEGDRIGCLTTAPHRCVSFTGGRCNTPADCADGACTKLDGVLTCGDPLGQVGCTDDAQCPSNQVCARISGGVRACLFRGGVLCPRAIGTTEGGRFTCASQICNIRGRCAPHDNSCVPENQDCDANEQCVNNRCQSVGGTPPRAVIDVAILRSAAVTSVKQLLSAEAAAKVKATPKR